MTDTTTTTSPHPPDAFLERVLDGRPIDHVPVIDLHAHVVPPRVAQTFPFSDPAEMVVALDRYGIDQACVSIAAGGRTGNDQMLAALDAVPGRFIGFVSVNPRYPGQITEDLERYFSHPMVKGLGEIHPTTYGHDYPITGDNYIPAWEFANARKLPVLIHSGPRSEAARCAPSMLGEVAAAYPDMNVLVGHSGGYDSWDMLDEAIAVVAEHDNMFLEICAMGRFFGAIEHMVAGVGAEKVVFGTDGPFHDWSAEIAHVACARLTEAEKALIFGGTAGRLLESAA